MNFSPTRAEALRRLEDFIPRAGSAYAEQRNYDHGPDQRENISTLSPYVTRRLVLESEIISKVLEQHSPQVAEKFIQEVLWRTYWKGWLQQRPGVWRDYLAQIKNRSGNLELYDQVVSQKSTLSWMNDWTRELIETGYLHNHTRMWYASVWIHTLKLPWALGAEFFYRHLLDADAASNTLSWRWVAGLQTKNKTYLASARNIEQFTDSRVRSDAETFAKNPVLLSEDSSLTKIERLQMTLVHEVANLLRQVKAEEVAVLIHDEDLQFLNSEIAQLPFSAVIVLDPQVAKGPVHSEKVIQFIRSCTEDEVSRVETKLGIKSIWLSSSDELVSILKTKLPSVRQVLCLSPGIGYTSDCLAQLKQSLNHQGLLFHQLARHWDAELFPHAKSGFFKFKEVGMNEALKLCWSET